MKTITNSRATQLAAGRLRLRARCIEERAQIADLSRHIESRLTGFDRGFSVVSSLTRWPVLVGAGAASVFIFGPARMLRWLGQGAMLLGVLRRLGGLISKI